MCIRDRFLAHTVELVDQAAKTFRELWPQVTVGCYAENVDVYKRQMF